MFFLNKSSTKVTYAKKLLQFPGSFCSSGKPQQVSVLLNLFSSFLYISQMLLCFLSMRKEYHR